MDLVVKGGVVVNHGPTQRADIGIRNGKIAQIGVDIPGDRVIDATDKLVIPGGIDMHVHLTGYLDWKWVDDFESGTAAAAAGGITTIGNITFPDPGESLLAALDRVEAESKAHSLIDFTLHPVVLDPTSEAIADIPRLIERGYSSIKTFTMLGHPFEPEHVDAITAAGRSGILTMIHCEDPAINDFCANSLLAAGKSTVSYYPDARPAYGEAVATARAIAIGRATQAPVYIVHISSAAALDETRRARARGQQVYVETRPIYLHLTRDRYDQENGRDYVCFPPLRNQSDADSLWSALRSGDIDTYCSDHAPLDRVQRDDATLTVADFKGAMPGLETLMPMLYSEGVRKGRLSLGRWVEVTSTNAAKLFGMFPQKGVIAVGSDADLVIWDPNERRTIRRSALHSKCDVDVFENWEVQGWPEYTLSRGEIVLEKDRIVGKPGRAERVMRKAFGVL
jgi:dihydropyrimidinase